MGTGISSSNAHNDGDDFNSGSSSSDTPPPSNKWASSIASLLLPLKRRGDDEPIDSTLTEVPIHDKQNPYDNAYKIQSLLGW